MLKLLDLIDSGDLCSLFFLILLAFLAGGAAVNNQPRLKIWGKRIAGAAFVLYIAHSFFTYRPETAEDWIHVTVRGFFLAGLVLGVSWILLASGEFLFRYIVKSPVNTVRNSVNRARYRREQEERDQRSEEERQQRAWEQAQELTRKREQAQTEAEAERRRTDARAAAVRSYSLYAPKIGKRFSKRMFDRYVEEFMGNAQLPADVERRGEELIDILEKHLLEADPPSKVTTLEDLTTWFLDQKQRMESLPLDDRVKRRHLAELNVRYAELTSVLLENMEP